MQISHKCCKKCISVMRNHGLRICAKRIISAASEVNRLFVQRKATAIAGRSIAIRDDVCAFCHVGRVTSKKVSRTSNKGVTACDAFFHAFLNSASFIDAVFRCRHAIYQKVLALFLPQYADPASAAAWQSFGPRSTEKNVLRRPVLVDFYFLARHFGQTLCRIKK